MSAINRTMKLKTETNIIIFYLNLKAFRIKLRKVKALLSRLKIRQTIISQRLNCIRFRVNEKNFKAKKFFLVKGLCEKICIIRLTIRPDFYDFVPPILAEIPPEIEDRFGLQTLFFLFFTEITSFQR